MKSRHREAWNKLIRDNYKELVRIARRYTDHPTDLVHHTYLRVIDKKKMSNAMGYFVKAMYREATIGQFKKQYQIIDNYVDYATATDDTMEKSIMREKLQMVIDHMTWFDRQVFTLYLDGWKMTEVARRSGIKESVLYKSLHNTRKTLHAVLGKQSNKE